MYVHRSAKELSGVHVHSPAAYIVQITQYSYRDLALDREFGPLQYAAYAVVCQLKRIYSRHKTSNSEEAPYVHPVPTEIAAGQRSLANSIFTSTLRYQLGASFVASEWSLFPFSVWEPCDEEVMKQSSDPFFCHYPRRRRRTAPVDGCLHSTPFYTDTSASGPRQVALPERQHITSQGLATSR